MGERELLTYLEAVELVGVSARTLKRMVQRGELTEYPFGKSKRLSRRELLTPRTKSGSGAKAD